MLHQTTPGRVVPQPSNKSVAIIGGGISGLMCGQRLRQLGVHNVTVFDTGKTDVGGRMSSRDVLVTLPTGQKNNVRIDHSAQLLSATTPRFQNILDQWTNLGVIQPYPAGSVGTINVSDASFAPRPPSLPTVYYPPQGMRSLAAHLSDGLTVRRPVWVGRVSRRDPTPGAAVLWDVYGERQRHLGAFDYLVVAHNGKCADRLMSTADAPAIHQLLRTKFTPKATPQQVMQMCSLWVYMAVFPSSLNLPWRAAFIEGDPELSYVSNNTTRINMNQAAEPLEAWTMISTRQFGSENKVPQEAIPPAKDREVKAALLDAFARVTGTPRASLSPVFQKVQLWGAAVPLNVTDTSCVLDADTGCGICGDWLVAPSLEGAALSGVALAEHIHSHATGKLKDSVGLNCTFQVTSSPALGAVPTPMAAPAAPSPRARPAQERPSRPQAQRTSAAQPQSAGRARTQARVPAGPSEGRPHNKVQPAAAPGGLLAKPVRAQSRVEP